MKDGVGDLTDKKICQTIKRWGKPYCVVGNGSDG